MSKGRYGYVAGLIAGGFLLVVVMSHLLTAPAPQGYQTMLVWGEKDHYVKPAALASMVTQMSQGQVELDWANGGREALLRSDDPKDKQGVLDQPIAFVDLEQQNAIKRITRQYERSAEAQTALRALDDLHIKILVTPMRIIAQ